MSVYIDPSFFVSLFISDASSAKADQALLDQAPELVMSDLSAAEFAAVIARRVRIQETTRANAAAIFSDFDEWRARHTRSIAVSGADMTTAEAFLRRLDLTIRTIDAIHIAIAQRVGAQLLTFDKKMARAARALGLDTIRT